jgi:membrane-bound lytic murein transglycosylase D
MLEPLFRARAIALALMLAGAAACTPAPYRVAQPAPAPSPVAVPDSAVPAAAPEKVDEGFALERVQNGAVGRELLGSATYDLPVEPNQWVATELSFLVNQRHDVVGRWLERSDRYSAFVQETFAAAGIPRDLHHLAMVESGYQPTARSRAGAVGMWQFMAGTGRGMGLRIDDQVDERMDPVRSTRAAARHLRQLWDDFGHDWALAAAAYNAGGGRISRGLRDFGSNSFWDLAVRGNLAEETRRYVPRLYAVTIIAKDPARFGYARPAGLVSRFEFDSMQVDLPTPLPVLARAGGISLAQLADLNPHLYRGTVPAYYWLWVPKGSGPALQQAYAASEFRRRGGYAWYTLRRGEDAAKVALAANLTVDQLRDLNLSANVDDLGRGDRVRLYADAARALDARPVERLASRDDDGDPGDGDSRASGRRRAARSSDDGDAPRRARPSDDDGDSQPRRSTSARRASDDDTSSRARTASSDTRRTRSADGDESSRGARSSDADESSRRARSSNGDDSPRRARSADGDASSSRARSPAGDDSPRRARASDGDESPRRSRAADDDDSPRRSRGSDGDDSGRESRRTASGERLAARHTVEDGETLYAIARKYDVTVAALREANDLGERSTLQPGQRLRIPRSSASSTASRDADDSRTSDRRRDTGVSSSSRTASRAGDGGESSSTRRAAASRARVAEHVVKSGETLWSIARSYDTTVDAIRDANDMRPDTVLQPGQKLRIPRRAAADDDR